MGDMRLEWIKEQLDLRGVSQRELGAAIGLTEQKMSHVMRGRRALSAREADSIRRFFGYELPEDLATPVAVAGKVGAGDQIELVDSYEQGAGMYVIERPSWVPAKGVVAAEIDGSSAEPWALNGDIIFWRRNHMGVDPMDLGRPVVAELADGRIMLKRLASGSKPGLWSLLSINPTHPNLIDVSVTWAARVFPPLTRDSVRIIHP